MRDALKLSVYVGDRDRVEGRLVADALMDAFDGAQSSVLLRGLEGFGIKHRLQSERSLTLSEDLPLVAVAVDSHARIEALAKEARALAAHGLITLERVRMLEDADGDGGQLVGEGELKLTIHVGRRERARGHPAYRAVVDCLHRHGLGGASVLLGLDGSTHGVRSRARFLGANSEVPLMAVSVGGSAEIAAALAELRSMLAAPSIGIERVQVCKRDGRLLARPAERPAPAGDGLAHWQKLTVYASESSRHGDEPLHGALIARLRAEGAAGATALRGIWGFHGEHPPHGERFWSLARHVPVLTVLLDTPANMARWFEIVDEMTGATGLVTSELVPALHTTGPEIAHGGLELSG
ncbi:MAG: DUF190 domain-containing protein [Solirubrobacteraceae bacterium]